MSNLGEIFSKIESRFDAAAAAGVTEVFQFNIDDSQYHIKVDNGECEVSEGAHDDPSVTLILDSDTFQEIVAGDLNGMQAFMAGRLRTEGNMMLATRLSDLFSF